MSSLWCNTGVSGWTERWFVLEGKRVMYYNQKGDRHPRGTLELNAGSRLKKIPTKEHAFHVVSDKQASFFTTEPKILPTVRPQADGADAP